MSNYTQQAICFLTTSNCLEQFKKPFSTFPSVRNSSLTDDPLRTNWALGSCLFRNKRRLQARNDSRRFFLLIVVPKVTDESSNFSRVDFHRFRTVNCAVLVTLLRQVQFVSNFLFWPLLNLGFSNKDSYCTTTKCNVSPIFGIFCLTVHFFLAYAICSEPSS